MASDPPDTPKGEPRQGDRRAADRRRTDRRTPLPPWRRPWALVAYGVVGTLLAVVLLNGGGDDEPGPGSRGDVVAAPPPPVTTAPPAAPGGAPEPARSTADFERLVIQGDAARGRRVLAELYCETPGGVALEEGTDTLELALAALVDTVGGRRVPGAACKWGTQNDPRREDFLLLVPAELARDFASAPVIMDGFVRRRRLVAEVEWIGKSRALALRTIGVFRGRSE
ncbi:MAG TPA: hypothetical protein VEW03_00995 [Longimicrobiaceae bacterium]|nr:hypothetical protein [Longimicrobiaceae bacterium]